MRVLLTETRNATARSCVQWLAAHDCEVLDSVPDGARVCQAVEALCPDALFLNLTLPGGDGFAVLQALSLLRIIRMPIVIMVIARGMEAFAERAKRMGAARTMARPFEPERALAVLESAGPFERMRPAWLTRARIEAVLDMLSIPKHLLGYGYLLDAIWISGADLSLARQLTTLVYPEVGRMRETDGHLAERSIRNAIEVAWSRGEMERQYAFFGNSIDSRRGKPTNGELIARVIDALRMEEW